MKTTYFEPPQRALSFGKSRDLLVFTMKVLAIKNRRLGDTALWTAALEALTQLPEIEIDIAFPKAYASLFEHDPRFQNQFPLEDSFWENKHFLKSFWERKYDYALSFHASQDTKKLAKLSAAKRIVIHHHSRKKNPFGSSILVPGLGQVAPATERDLNVVRTLGWSGVSPVPRLHRLATREAESRDWMVARKIDLSKPLVLLGPGASRPSKLWPLYRYAGLAKDLAKEFSVATLLENDTLLKDDPVSARQLLSHAPLLETSTLRQLLGVMPWASLYVGSDSGVKHVACAMGVKTVTIFGPESVGEWHPYSKSSHRALQVPLQCRKEDANGPDGALYAWCGVTICPLSSHACVNLIPVSEVLAHSRQLLLE